MAADPSDAARAKKKALIYPTVSAVLLEDSKKDALNKTFAVFAEAFAGRREQYENDAITQKRIEPTMSFVELMPNFRKDDELQAYSGFAAEVRADVAYEPRALASLINIRTGTGRTWMRLDAIKDEDALVATHAKALADVPNIDTMRVAVVEGRDVGRKRVHLMVVEGNDRSAAAELIRTTQTSAKTLGEIRKSPAYESCVTRSRELRESVARAAAAKLGLTVASDAIVHDAITYHTSNVRNDTDMDKRMNTHPTVVVYSDTTPLDETRHGALVFHGPVSGYTWYRAPEHVDSETQSLSRSWSNPTSKRAFSVMPTDTGLFDHASQRIAAQHAAQSPDLREATAERVRSYGPVADINPRVEEAYHSTGDHDWMRVAAILDALPTFKSGEKQTSVTGLDLEAIVCTVPGIQTKGLSMQRVAALVHNSSIEKVPVSRSVVFDAMAKYWDLIPLSHTTSAADIFRHEESDHFIVDKHVILALAEAEREK